MSDSQKIDYIPVLNASQLKPGERTVLEINGKALILFHVANDYFAIINRCSHEYQTLEEGELDGFVITCPRHGAKFDIRSGNALTLPAVEKIQNIPVRVVDGMVEVQL